MAKFVCLESLRKEKNHLNIDEVDVQDKTFELNNAFSNECLDKCLNELSKENRDLLLDYYSEEKRAKIELHKQLTEKLNLTKSALRMKILRIKQRLRICLDECAA